MAAESGEQFAQSSSNTGSESFLGGIVSWETIWTVFIKLIIAIIIVLLLLFMSKVFSRFVTKRLKTNSIVDDDYTNKISGLVGEIIFYTLLVISLLIGFTIVGIDFGWILGGISFGIGFAFKDILGNLISGILVLTNKEFKLGDIIVVDDEKKDYFGRIEEITIRYTVIRTFDLRKVIIPNLTLVTKPVRTYDSEDLVRLETNFTVHYGTHLQDVQKLIIECVNKLGIVKEKQSTRVNIQKFGRNGVELQIFFYFDPASGVIIPTAMSEVHTAIMDMFKDNGIVIPYPHRTLTVDHNDKNLLGSMLYVAQEAAKSRGN